MSTIRSTPPGKDDFAAALDDMLRASTGSHVDVTSRELHLIVGGYPKPFPRMPVCCAAMKAAMAVGDTILTQPPKGQGATLTIRYKLPRSGVGGSPERSRPTPPVDPGDELNRLRRQVIRLLQRIDPVGAGNREAPTAAIKRLEAHGKIPKRIMTQMLAIVALRNETEYGQYAPTPMEMQATRSAWQVVVEWANMMGHGERDANSSGT